MLRVAELMRHAVAQLLARGQVSDPILDAHTITVSRVQMSPDLKLATIYVAPLGGKDETDVLKALDRHKRYMRGEVTLSINLKFSPDIRFRIDDSFDAVSKIDALLNSEQVRRDLHPDRGATDDGSDS